MFQSAEVGHQGGMSLSVHAATKDGKTHFALTAPGPIWLINLDLAYREALKNVAAERPGLVVEVATHRIGEELDLDDAWVVAPGSNLAMPEPIARPGVILERLRRNRTLFKAIATDYRLAEAEADKVGGTVIIDPASKVWNLVQVIKLDEIRLRFSGAGTRGKGEAVAPEQAKPMQLDYGEANSLMEAFYAHSLERDANTIFLHRSKPQYGQNGQQTGRIEFNGFKEANSIPQVMLRLSRTKTGRLATVEASRINFNQIGLEIEDPDFELVRAVLLGE